MGLTFPGIIDEPGSLAGKVISEIPDLGPEPNKRMSLAIFINETARVFKAPWAITMASCAAKDSNLLGAVLNLRPVISEILSATLSANSG